MTSPPGTVSSPQLRPRCSCGDATVSGDEVVVSMGPSSAGVFQPSQMRLASLRRSIKNASMADLAQSEVKTEV